MAKTKRRLKSADEAFMGPKPTYVLDNDILTEVSKNTKFKDEVSRMHEWMRGTRWFYYFEVKAKSAVTVQNYCKNVLGFNKDQIANLKKLADWKYRMKTYQTIAMLNSGWVGYPIDDRLEKVNKILWECEKEGSKIIKEVSNKPKKPVIPPAERTRIKLMETLYADFDEIIVEGWFEGDFTQKFNLYSRFKGHGFKGNAIEPFRRMIMPEYECIKDAYDKTCEQAVEAYSHIGKADKRKILKQYEDMFKDMDKLKQSFKAQRVPRAHKRKTSDEQVTHLQYQNECEDSKLASINPVMIPGKHKLWVYNTKQRRLTEYVTTATDGFLIAGTSIKNHDEKLSKTATLRKPDDMLPIVLSKTEKQLEKFWDDITTKINSPNGRVNKDCILMRVFE